MTDERLLSKSEAAYRLGVSEKTIDRLVASGKLATRKVGKRSKFEPGEIERYLQPTQVEQPPEG